MCFKVVNSDLFDELEVEYELHNYPTITVYNKISGGLLYYMKMIMEMSLKFMSLLVSTIY